MNFLFHCWEFPPLGSGIGAYVQQMSRALHGAGHRVVVVTSGDGVLPAEEDVGYATIHRAYSFGEIGGGRVRDIVLGEARNHNIDVIEAADHLGESAAVIRSPHRPPVITKCHYNDVLRAPRYAQALYLWQKPLISLACFRQRRRLAAERYSIESADALIVPCRRILEEIRKDGLRTPGKVAIIPNPYSPGVIPSSGERGTPVLLLAGRIDIGKGIQYIPRLLELLRVRHPALRIEIAGDDTSARGVGSLRLWLTGRLGSGAESVDFLGKLSREQLTAAYSRAWVVVVPSRWDTFPTVVLEAMGMSRAVVASPNGGMPEMLEGTSCKVADPSTPDFAAAVASFLDDRNAREVAGRSAYAKLNSEYSPGAVAARYLEFVKEFSAHRC